MIYHEVQCTNIKFCLYKHDYLKTALAIMVESRLESILNEDLTAGIKKQNKSRKMKPVRQILLP